MITRLFAILAGAGALFLLPLAASAANDPPSPTYLPPCTSGEVTFSLAQVPDPAVSVNPVQGPAGSQATLSVRNFTPGEKISATFRSAGDPVVATGTVGPDGRAVLTFTVPQAPAGSYWILVAEPNRTCIHAAVRFTIGPAQATPTPRPPTATPTPVPAGTVAPPTATAVPPTATPTAQPTPRVPSAGSGGSSTPGGFDATVVTLGLLLLSAASLLVGMANRRRNPRRVYIETALPRQKTHPADPDGPTSPVEPRMRDQR